MFKSVQKSSIWGVSMRNLRERNELLRHFSSLKKTEQKPQKAQNRPNYQQNGPKFRLQMSISHRNSTPAPHQPTKHSLSQTKLFFSELLGIFDHHINILTKHCLIKPNSLKNTTQKSLLFTHHPPFHSKSPSRSLLKTTHCHFSSNKPTSPGPQPFKHSSKSSPPPTQPEVLEYAQDHTKPDPVSFLRQHENQIFHVNKSINTQNPARKSDIIKPSDKVAEIAARKKTLEDKLTFFQKLRFKHPLTRPLKMEEDLPMIIDKNDPKSSPQLFLPQSNYPLFIRGLINMPDTIVIPRKDAVVPFLVYLCIGLMISLVSGLPRVLALSKDAEKKHLILQKEVQKEEKFFNFMQRQMTIGEIQLAVSSLPRQPGLEWNPDEDAEMERLSKRVYYPG
jgi:hypothetical protein